MLQLCGDANFPEKAIGAEHLRRAQDRAP
jgi:hypothetical protein